MGAAPAYSKSEGHCAPSERKVFCMKRGLAGLLIFGMVGAAMMVPALAAGHHGGGRGGCCRNSAVTQNGVCPWGGDDCPWGGGCGGWCVNGGLCDGTGWARHHG